MRTFYLFKINKEFVTLTKRSSYSLYKMMESIYNLKYDDLDLGYNMYRQLVKPFNKDYMNKYFLRRYKENDHYTKYNNNHMINNYYTDEKSKLVINNTFLLLKTSKIKPIFFKDLKKEEGLFVCDFINKDYFWLDSVL